MEVASPSGRRCSNLFDPRFESVFCAALRITLSASKSIYLPVGLANWLFLGLNGLVVYFG